MRQDSNKPLRTRIPTPVLIFLLADIVLCGGAIVYFALANDEIIIMRILVFIMCGIFFLLGFIQLLAELLNFIEIKDDKVVVHKWLTHTKLSFDKISYVTNKDGLYTLYVKNKKFYTFSTGLKEASEIIVYLESHGVNIKW